MNNVVKLLEKYQSKHPHLRIGQIIINAASEEGEDFDPFYMKDEVLAAILEKWLEFDAHNKRQGPSNNV